MKLGASFFSLGGFVLKHINDLEKKKFIKGMNRKGVELTQVELKMLSFLFEQNMLRGEDLYAFLTNHLSITKKSFGNKMARWRNYDVVHGQKVRVGQDGFAFYIYQLGKWGAEILVNEGMIPESALPIKIQNGYERKQLSHLFGTKQLVLDAVLHCEEDKIESFNPYDKTYHELVNKVEPKFIVPDWVLRSEDRYVYIEVDSGSERLQVIENKVKKYIELSLKYPERNHIVLFSVIEEKDVFFSPSEEQKQRQVRIDNMKQKLYQLHNLLQNNLSVYVLHSSRASEVIPQLLSGDKPLPVSYVDMELDTTWSILDQHNEYFAFELNSISDKDVYLHDVDHSLYADRVYEVVHPLGNFKEIVLFIVLDEGNVQVYERLQYLSTAIDGNHFKQKVHKIIGIYPDKEQRSNDVIGMLTDNVLYIDNQSLMEGSDQVPVFYRHKTKLLVEETTYEG